MTAAQSPTGNSAASMNGERARRGKRKRERGREREKRNSRLRLRAKNNPAGHGHKETEASPVIHEEQYQAQHIHEFYTCAGAKSLASHCCRLFLSLPTLRLHLHVETTNSLHAATCSGHSHFAWLPNETGTLLVETPANVRPMSWITRSNLELRFDSQLKLILCRRSAIKEANTLVAGLSA